MWTSTTFCRCPSTNSLLSLGISLSVSRKHTVFFHIRRRVKASNVGVKTIYFCAENMRRFASLWKEEEGKKNPVCFGSWLQTLHRCFLRRCRNEAVLPSGVNKVDLIWYHPPVSSCLISPGHIDTREGKQSFRCSREIKTKLFFCLATWQQIDFLFFSFFFSSDLTLLALHLFLGSSLFILDNSKASWYERREDRIFSPVFEASCQKNGCLWLSGAWLGLSHFWEEVKKNNNNETRANSC